MEYLRNFENPGNIATIQEYSIFVNKNLRNVEYVAKNHMSLSHCIQTIRPETVYIQIVVTEDVSIWQAHKV